MNKRSDQRSEEDERVASAAASGKRMSLPQAIQMFHLVAMEAEATTRKWSLGIEQDIPPEDFIPTIERFEHMLTILRNSVSQ